MKVTLVFSVIIVIFNVNVFGYKQYLRSSKDSVPHYVRCGKGDPRCGRDNRNLDGNNRNCEFGGRCGKSLLERIAYGRNTDENDRCGCVKGAARIRKQKYSDDDRCDCNGNRNGQEMCRCGKSTGRCNCGRSGDQNEIVGRCACDDKPTLLYIEESESSEDSSVEEQSDELNDGGETPQAITELLHEYGKDFLMIGKVLSEVARRSNYIGAVNDGYVSYHRGCPPGKVQSMTGACVNLIDLLPTTTTQQPASTTKQNKSAIQKKNPDTLKEIKS